MKATIDDVTITADPECDNCDGTGFYEQPEGDDPGTFCHFCLCDAIRRGEIDGVADDVAYQGGKIVPGQKFTFESSSSYDGEPGFNERSGEVIELIRELTDKECDKECQPMYLAKFEDGVEVSVFGDELRRIGPSLLDYAEERSI